MKKETKELTLEQQAQTESEQLEEQKVVIDGFDADPLEDLDIDFLLEEVENKIAPLALA